MNLPLNQMKPALYPADVPLNPANLPLIQVNLGFHLARPR